MENIEKMVQEALDSTKSAHKRICLLYTSDAADEL